MSQRGGAGNGGDDSGREASPYVELERAAWASLASSPDTTESPLTPDEIASLRGLGDALDLQEVQDVYLPVSRLLSLYVESARSLHHQQEQFLGTAPSRRTRRS